MRRSRYVVIENAFCSRCRVFDTASSMHRQRVVSNVGSPTRRVLEDAFPRTPYRERRRASTAPFG